MRRTKKVAAATTTSKGKSGASVADLVPPRSNTQVLEAMGKVAGSMQGWKPARQVLKEVRAVPTVFCQYDQATRVGGHPIARISMIHGPSNEGKTIFSLGIEMSFLKLNHFVAHIDAEMTTPITWVEKLMGPYADHQGYMALRPRSFEDAVDRCREFMDAIGEAKIKGLIPKDTSGIMVVDSLRKLVPKGLMAKMAKEGAEEVGMDGMRGRAAMFRAALTAQWLDEMVPHLADTDCALMLIARETVDTEADANDRKYGDPYNIGGGKAPIYDSSIVARIERYSWVYKGTDPKTRETVGERIQARIWKTKVGGKDRKVTDCYFHLSNGLLVPEGFDHARDVLELAKEMGVVQGESWLTWNGQKWQGENQAVLRLTAAPDMLAQLEAQVRGGFVLEGATPSAA